MSTYDDLFAETAPSDSVFAEKRALNPLVTPEEIRGRETQERQLATILNGVHFLTVGTLEATRSSRLLGRLLVAATSNE